MLDTAALASVHCQLTGDCMVIKGCQDQVEKVSGTTPFMRLLE